MKFVDDVKKKLDDVRSKPWAPTVATVMGVTGAVAAAMDPWVPGVGIIGGALKLGSSMLDPNPKLSHLNKQF